MTGSASSLTAYKEMSIDHGLSGKAEIIDMIKILSHDIRSPLITIAAGLKLLQKGAYGPIDKGVMEELGKLYEIVLKTAGNMEDFLEKAFSLNENLNSHHEPLDIDMDILNPVLGELRKEIREGTISLKNGISRKGFYFTVGNSFLLKAVFRNILCNALKYGGKDCKIYIDIDEGGPLYKLNVFNSGTPVPEENRDMLFKKFCRIGKEDEGDLGGIGLGLYLIRKILENHGGTIWYKAEQNGSNFIFTLPKYEKQGIPKCSVMEQSHGNDNILSTYSLSKHQS